MNEFSVENAFRSATLVVKPYRDPFGLSAGRGDVRTFFKLLCPEGRAELSTVVIYMNGAYEQETRAQRAQRVKSSTADAWRKPCNSRTTCLDAASCWVTRTFGSPSCGQQAAYDPGAHTRIQEAVGLTPRALAAAVLPRDPLAESTAQRCRAPAQREHRRPVASSLPPLRTGSLGGITVSSK